MLLRPSYPSDSGGQIRTQQPGISGLVRQSANGREPKIDGRCSVTRLLQIESISSHDGLVECEPRFRAVPVDKIANGVIVGALGAWGREAVESCRSGLFEIREPQNCFGVAFTF